MNTTNDVMVPMMLLGAALLLYVGFFKAMKEWIQTRVGGGGGNQTPPSGPPGFYSNPKDQPPGPIIA